MVTKRELFKQAKPNPKEYGIYTTNQNPATAKFAAIASGMDDIVRDQTEQNLALSNPNAYINARNRTVSLVVNKISTESKEFYKTITSRRNQGGFFLHDEKKIKELVATHAKMMGSLYDNVIEYIYPQKYYEMALNAAMLENKATL